MMDTEAKIEKFKQIYSSRGETILNSILHTHAVIYTNAILIAIH